MNNKIKNIITVTVMTLLLFIGLAICIFKADTDYSDSERRVLSKAPELTIQNILSTEYMSEFEEYTTDQFPFRDTFRSLKAFAEFNIFCKSDNNDIYTSKGHLTKLEYPLSYDMLDNAADKFMYLYNSYIKGNGGDVYLSVIPDKNKFLADKHLSIDYNKLISYIREKTEYAEYIDIQSLLEADDYYFTDTHWRQECITDIANRLANGMGVSLSGEYTVNKLEHPFYGVYSGQYSLSVKPDTINYLTNDTLDSFIVTSYDSGKPEPKELYDMQEAKGRDPYEMFTSGSDALITIENPNAKETNELIIFRDSFASSIAPLLAEGYSNITLIDIRYIQSDLLSQFVEFEGRDVLFLYSTMLLNNSMGMK